MDCLLHGPVDDLSRRTGEPGALEALKVLRDAEGRIALEYGDGTIHRDVRVRKAAPLTHPGHYIVFLDTRGRELCFVSDPSRLSRDAQAAVRAALEHHYVSSQVLAVLGLRVEGDVCYVQAETSRGRRDFVVSNLDQGLRRPGARRLLFVAADGNRFEIEDSERLDRRSVALLKRVL